VVRLKKEKVKGKMKVVFVILGLIFTNSILAKTPPRLMEKLNRGVVAVRFEEKKVWVAWRLLATDDDKIAFNIYRETDGKALKLNDKPITDVTFWVDEKTDLSKQNSYFIRPVINKKEQNPSEKFTLNADTPIRQYLSTPLQTPHGYTPNDASVGDLDGDGEYEIVLHQVGRGRDNGQAGTTTEPILQAYKLNGKLLWQINLGKNIREGAHYTQFLVYDFDGDGRAEIACKTADGTIDGRGKIIGNKDADWCFKAGETLDGINRPGETGRRSAEGYILRGPEFLTVAIGARNLFCGLPITKNCGFIQL
jgi:rhamnogalacturonan endolyase